MCCAIIFSNFKTQRCGIVNNTYSIERDVGWCEALGRVCGTHRRAAALKLRKGRRELPSQSKDVFASEGIPQGVKKSGTAES